LKTSTKLLIYLFFPASAWTLLSYMFGGALGLAMFTLGSLYGAITYITFRTYQREKLKEALSERFKDWDNEPMDPGTRL